MSVNPAPFRFFSPWLLLLTAVWLLIYLLVFPHPGELFLRNWPLIFIGILGAIIGNMTAIGGGIVFIPVLMFFYKTDPMSALKLSFVTQAVGMTSGATGWLQRKEVPVNLLKWTIPPLVLGTIVSTFVFHPQPIMVKGLFGPISFLVGILTLILLNRKGHLDVLPSKAMLPVFFISFIGGMITGWVAIGEGEIIAAFCMLAYGLNANKAVGLGVVLLSVNSILLALLHSLYFGGVPWEMAMFTMISVLWGGRMGPMLAAKVSSKTVKRIFAWIAVLDGLVIMFQVAKVWWMK